MLVCHSLGAVGFICTESQCLDHMVLVHSLARAKLVMFFVSTVFCEEERK